MNLQRATDRQARVAMNQAWRNYEYQTGQVRLRSMPDIFAIESTNFCNLKCIMCPRGEPDLMDRPLGHMSDDLFKKILDGWEFYTTPAWFHFFGEPLMHPNLFDQIEYAKRAGVPNLAISSNATLLTKLNAARLLDSGLDTLMLSIDGNNKETYEKVRKNPAFTYEQVVEQVRTFLAMRKRARKTRPHTILQIIVMEETRDELDAFKAFWESEGADQIVVKQYTTWGGQENHEPFKDHAVSEQRAWFDSVKLATRKHPCFYLWSSVVIGWDGRVVPCCFDYNNYAVMGDLQTQTLEEVWNGPEYLAMRAAELEGRNDNPLCKNCKEAPGIERDPATPPPPADISQLVSTPVHAAPSYPTGI